jgi:hypothetical protein
MLTPNPFEANPGFPRRCLEGPHAAGLGRRVNGPYGAYPGPTLTGSPSVGIRWDQAPGIEPEAQGRSVLLSLERGAAGLSHSRDPDVVSRINPDVRLLGSVRSCLFHEVLFVQAAHAYGDVGGHCPVPALSLRSTVVLTPRLSADSIES